MKYYCIGIKGAGMSTLANILFDLGNSVSGYDDAKDYKFTQEGLDSRGIKICYDGNNELDSDTIVTYSKAVRKDHPELKRVTELGLTLKEYNEVVGDVTKLFETICVSGTHGKTTTSLLISNIINNTLGCNYFVGDGTGHALADNKIFVLEADEYNKHFLAYHPTITIITNIELEHVECYNGIEDIINTFETLANKSKLSIVCGDNENVRKVHYNSKVVYYGFEDNNDVVAKNVTLNDLGSTFDVYMSGTLYGHFDLPLFGKHMILNALAAIIVCNNYGIAQGKIHKYITEFKGAKRRFKETVIKDVVTIDDYAHHPTEVKVTLEAARQKYPDKELVAVFKPNTYSRTKELWPGFVEALKLADKSYVTDVYCDRERQEDYPSINSHLIREKLNNCERITDDDANMLLKHKNAVICFMSCKDIYTLKNKYEELIK